MSLVMRGKKRFYKSELNLKRTPLKSSITCAILSSKISHPLVKRAVKNNLTIRNDMVDLDGNGS